MTVRRTGANRVFRGSPSAPFGDPSFEPPHTKAFAGNLGVTLGSGDQNHAVTLLLDTRYRDIGYRGYSISTGNPLGRSANIERPERVPWDSKSPSAAPNLGFCHLFTLQSANHRKAKSLIQAALHPGQ
jgi:hypothetical protein